MSRVKLLLIFFVTLHVLLGEARSQHGASATCSEIEDKLTKQSVSVTTSLHESNRTSCWIVIQTSNGDDLDLSIRQFSSVRRSKSSFDASVLGLELLADYDNKRRLPSELGSAREYWDELIFVEPRGGSSGVILARRGKRVLQLLTSSRETLIEFEGYLRNKIRL
jgi:hypothetical protein